MKKLQVIKVLAVGVIFVVVGWIITDIGWAGAIEHVSNVGGGPYREGIGVRNVGARTIGRPLPSIPLRNGGRVSVSEETYKAWLKNQQKQTEEISEVSSSLVETQGYTIPQSPEKSLVDRNNAIMQASSNIGLSRTGQIITPSGTRDAQIVTPQGVRNGTIVTNSQNNNGGGRYAKSTSTQQPSATPKRYVRIISGRKFQMLQQEFSQMPNGQALFEKLFAPYGNGYVRIYDEKYVQQIAQQFSRLPNGQALLEYLFAPYDGE